MIQVQYRPPVQAPSQRGPGPRAPHPEIRVLEGPTLAAAPMLGAGQPTAREGLVALCGAARP
jgi:hypothetical protein